MATRLLSLPGDHRRLSLVTFARRLAWLHFHAGERCEQFVLSALDEDDPAGMRCSQVFSCARSSATKDSIGCLYP
jgi:hypothetical protein